VRRRSASISLRCGSGAVIDLELDFRHVGAQTWDIDFDTDGGPIKLSAGGSELCVDNVSVLQAFASLRNEYASIYLRFVDLVRAQRSEVDARPMQLVADIFLLGKRVMVEPFLGAAP